MECCTFLHSPGVPNSTFKVSSPCPLCVCGVKNLEPGWFVPSLVPLLRQNEEKRKQSPPKSQLASMLPFNWTHGFMSPSSTRGSDPPLQPLSLSLTPLQLSQGALSPRQPLWSQSYLSHSHPSSPRGPGPVSKTSHILATLQRDLVYCALCFSCRGFSPFTGQPNNVGELVCPRGGGRRADCASPKPPAKALCVE